METQKILGRLFDGTWLEVARIQSIELQRHTTFVQDNLRYTNPKLLIGIDTGRTFSIEYSGQRFASDSIQDSLKLAESRAIIDRDYIGRICNNDFKIYWKPDPSYAKENKTACADFQEHIKYLFQKGQLSITHKSERSYIGYQLINDDSAMPISVVEYAPFYNMTVGRHNDNYIWKWN